MKLKKFCNGIEIYRGVGAVLITDGEDVERFDDCCFTAERGDIYNGRDGFLDCSVMVGFDQDRLDFVVDGLEKIVARLKSNARKNKIIPEARRSDADPED